MISSGLCLLVAILASSPRIAICAAEMTVFGGRLRAGRPGGDCASRPPGARRTGHFLASAPDALVLPSRLREFERDEAIALRGLDPHHHRLLAVALSGGNLGLDFARLRNGLAGNVENHVAGCDALVRRDAVGIDADDGDALVSGAGDLRGRRQAGGRAWSARLFVLRGAPGGLLVLLRAERSVSGLFVAIAQKAKSRPCRRASSRRPAGEIGGILDRLTVDFGDDVAGLQARRGGRRARHRPGRPGRRPRL